MRTGFLVDRAADGEMGRIGRQPEILCAGTVSAVIASSPLDELDDHSVGVGDLEEALPARFLAQWHGDPNSRRAQPFFLLLQAGGDGEGRNQTTDTLITLLGRQHLDARMITDSPTSSTCVRGLHDQRAHHLARAPAEATGARTDDITVRTVAELLGTVHRMLFHRTQELTLAGLPNERIARTVTAEADQALDLLEPALSDYATA
ncbi:hypothetical protein ACFY9S_03100 [Streptomyces sp. NPDC012474]|uniref:hypothetical protein n=1 Tax=Streptomyces sp. NPDC012474 TaxID=3364836 RepID=UPI0036EADD8C